MMTPILKYFEAEKMYCIAGAMVGSISVIAGLLLLIRSRVSFFRGMSYPLIILGCLFSAICFTVAMRASSDIDRVSLGILEDDALKIRGEILRMENVMKNFKLMIGAEICLLGACCLSLLLFKSGIARGLAAGIIVQASLFLVFDIVAQIRAKEYTEFLMRLPSSLL